MTQPYWQHNRPAQQWELTYGGEQIVGFVTEEFISRAGDFARGYVTGRFPVPLPDEAWPSDRAPS